ncbi:MAG: hypothetical protein EOO15_08465 [Chitinophagaceae bacterium]|nr:MAG: hypothetical protein EOO15_08465 [Chitinophagaceae bacterium]
MRNTIFYLLVAASSAAQGQSVMEPLGTRYLLLTTLAPSFTSAAAQEFNPAATAHLTRFSATLSGERRFLLRELSSYRLHAAFPFAKGSAGAGLVSGSNPSWQELGLRGSYARRLGPRAAVGIGVQWLQVGNSTYGRASALIASAGFQWELAPGVHAALQVSNPARTRLGKEQDERLPATYSLGAGWQLEGQWMLAAALLHRDGHPPSLLAGAEYVFAKLLRARCGVDSGAPAAWLGLGTTAAGLRLDVTVTLHRELGASPVLQLIYPAQ